MYRQSLKVYIIAINPVKLATYPLMNKLDKLCEKSDLYDLVDTGKSILDGEITSKTYRVKDKSLVSFRAKKMERGSRQMTDEQRQAMVEHLARAREARAKKEAK